MRTKRLLCPPKAVWKFEQSESLSNLTLHVVSLDKLICKKENGSADCRGLQSTILTFMQWPSDLNWISFAILYNVFLLVLPDNLTCGGDQQMPGHLHGIHLVLEIRNALQFQHGTIVMDANLTKETMIRSLGDRGMSRTGLLLAIYFDIK